MRRASFAVLPIRDHAFFEQAVLERGFCQRLLELARLGSQRLDLVRSGLARGIASEPLLAGLQELLGPAIIEVLSDAFLAAQLGDAVLAAQPVQNDADLLLGGELSPGGDGATVSWRHDAASLRGASPFDAEAVASRAQL